MANTFFKQVVITCNRNKHMAATVKHSLKKSQWNQIQNMQALIKQHESQIDCWFKCEASFRFRLLVQHFC